MFMTNMPTHGDAKIDWRSPRAIKKWRNEYMREYRKQQKAARAVMNQIHDRQSR
jgi:hypothetical protein